MCVLILVVKDWFVVFFGFLMLILEVFFFVRLRFFGWFLVIVLNFVELFVLMCVLFLSSWYLLLIGFIVLRERRGCFLDFLRCVLFVSVV